MADPVKGFPHPVAVWGWDTANHQPFLVDTHGRVVAKVIGNLITEAYDYISLTYTSNNLTKVTYKTGGALGTIVATLDLTYTGTQLDTITAANFPGVGFGLGEGGLGGD